VVAVTLAGAVVAGGCAGGAGGGVHATRPTAPIVRPSRARRIPRRARRGPAVRMLSHRRHGDPA
jgi:hypothetical protein